jgi:hypothetical protein
MYGHPLGYRCAVRHHPTHSGADQPAEDMKQRTFAGTGRARNQGNLACFKTGIDSVQNDLFASIGVKPAEREIFARKAFFQ